MRDICLIVSAPFSARFPRRPFCSLSLAKLCRCLEMLLEEWSPFSAAGGSRGPHYDEEVAIVRKVRGRLAPCRRGAEEEEGSRMSRSVGQDGRVYL